MTTELLNRYHLPFVCAIPVVLFAMYLGGESDIEFQMHDAYIVIPKFQISFLFLITLALKSGLYYLSNRIKFISFFYKADVLLTVALVCIGYYYIALTHADPLTPDTVALMTLVFASWILIQLLVAVNYLTLIFFGEE